MKQYEMILFDMDGTLLPMDIEEFTKGYFKLLCKKLVPMGFEKDSLINAIWTGTGAMVQNDGKFTNKEVFFAAYEKCLNRSAVKDQPLFDEFYANEFDGAKDFCGYDPKVSDFIKELKSAGYRVAVATNPIFPQMAMRKRLSWAGLDPDGFEHITSYENSHFCKPNPAYYTEVAEKLGVNPDKCLMIGNDATEDLAAAKTGMDVFILTDHLLNRNNVDITSVPHGGYQELHQYIFEK